MYQKKKKKKKCCEDKHVDLLLIGDGQKKHYVLIKYNTLMYHHSLHRRSKHFCRHGLHASNTEEILKCHIKDCFKSNC